MAKKHTPTHFSNVLDEENPTPVAPAGKREQLNFPIDSDTKKRLARAVFWKGKKTNQKSYLADILKEALANDPDADKPIPGE